MPAPSSSPLLRLHKLLIASALALAALMAAWSLARFRREGGALPLLVAIASAGTGGAMVWYLRRGLRKFDGR
jgi:hypothetical protein